MSKTLHKYFYERLASVFQDYLKEFSPENISQINLGAQNNFTLKGLKFKEELLLVNSIPLIIKEGQIGKIKFDVPSLFRNIAMKIEIENVEIRVRLLVEHQPNKGTNQNPEEEAPKNFNYKQKKLDDWESKVSKYFQELAPPSWARKVIDNILKNMSISIKNFNIYYENTSLMGHPTMIKINFKELTVHTTDETHAPAFNSGTDLHYREINVSEFSVTLNLNKKKSPSNLNYMHKKDHHLETNAKTALKVTHNNVVNQVSADQKAATKGFRYTTDRNNLEDEYKKLREHETYLVFPFDAIARIRTQYDLSKDFRNQPQIEMTLKFKEPIVLVLNTDNMKYLSALVDNFETMKIIQKNIHLRPGDRPQREPSSNIKLWWRYFKNAIIEDKKSSGNLINTTKWKINMKKYIDLYKRRQEIIHVPWLPHLSNEEKFNLMKLEEEIPLPNLLQFREWALIEIRIEAKRFFASNKDVQGIKPLIDIWSNAINNEEVFTSSKEKISDTIRLTPLEQSDLYDILRQDKAKVLESYLKGENNEPKDQIYSIVLSIKSFYILVSEPKPKTSQTISPGFMKVSSLHRVGDWINEPHANMDHFEHVSECDSIEQRMGQDFRDDEYDLTTQRNDEDEFLSAKDDYQEQSISQSKKLGRRGFSHRSNHNTNYDSFDEHLKDVLDPKDKHFKIDFDEFTKHDEKHEVLTLDTDANSHEWWNQNLILFVEVLRINTSLVMFRNEGMKTEKNLTCQSIMITTALNLEKATTHRDSKYRDKHGLNYSALLEKILFYDFSATFRNKEHPLFNYLIDNKCAAAAEFLRLYNNDRKLTGGILNIQDVDAYSKFFNKESQSYLGKWFDGDDDELVKEYNSVHQSVSTKREPLITRAFAKIHSEINKSILPGFLYNYGVLVIPIMFKSESYIVDEELNKHLTQKEAKDFAELYGRYPSRVTGKEIIKKTKTKDHKKEGQKHGNAVLDLFFSIEGTKSQFRIERIDLKKTNNGFGIEEVNDDSEGSSNVNFKMDELKIFLSTESLKPLLGFANSLPSSSNETQSAKLDDKMSVEDYQTLMNCIEYKNQHNHDTNDKSEEKKLPETEVKLKSLTIVISNYLPTLLTSRTLEIKAQVKATGKPAIGNENVMNADKTEQLYDRFHIQLQNFSICEIEENSLLRNKIFETKMSIYFYNCILKNHPLYTDQKLHVAIPYLMFSLDNDLILFSEVLQAIVASNTENTKKQKAKTPEFIPMGPNQKIMLSNRLNTLLSDHRVTQKNCKHCILRHKKSIMMLNVFIGRLDQYYHNLAETSFKNFELDEILIDRKDDYPPGLTISIGHNLTNSLSKNARALLNIQFICVSRDLGFFKDNLTVHCTESSPVVVNKDLDEMDKTAILAKFCPIIKVENKIIKNLDDNFWKYFRDVEKELSNQPEISTNKDRLSKKYDEDDESSKQLYLVVFRKKFLKTDVLKKFEIKGEDKNFSNYLIVRLKDFQINFGTLSSFLAVSSTLKNLAYLQEFFEAFYADKAEKSSSKDEDNFTRTKIPSMQKYKSSDEIRVKGYDFKRNVTNGRFMTDDPRLQSPNFKKDEGKEFYDLTDIKRFIERENISLIIDDFSFNIDILNRNHIVELKMEKFCLENFPDKTFHGFKSRLDIVDLLKIKSISFRTTTTAKLRIEDINIRYISGAIEFSINKIGFSSWSTGVPDLFLFKPEENKNRNHHAIMMKIYFSSKVVERIEVNLAPLSVCLSDQELSTEISSLSLVSNLFQLEDAAFPMILEKKIFRGNFFEFISKRKAKLLKEACDIIVQESTPSHLGILEASEEAKLIVTCDKINSQFRIGKTTFCNIKLANLSFEQSSDSNYDIGLEVAAFEPYDTNYKNLFMSTRKDTNLKVSIKNKGEYPEVTIKDAKVIYIARAIKELTLFNKEIRKKIVHYADDLQRQMSDEVKTFENKAGSIIDDAPFLGIKIQNSCIVIPRDSKSSDIFVANFEEFSGVVKRVKKKMKMPKKDFEGRIIEDQVVPEKQDWYEHIGSVFLNIEANIEHAFLRYYLSDRNVYIGNAKSIGLNMILPDEDLYSGKWLYDGDFDINLQDYELDMNMASIEEMIQIITTNTKQQPELFEKKPTVFEHTSLSIEGNRIEAKIDKAIIPKEHADQLPGKTEKQENKNFDAEKHVDKILKEMKII